MDKTIRENLMALCHNFELGSKECVISAIYETIYRCHNKNQIPKLGSDFSKEKKLVS